MIQTAQKLAPQESDPILSCFEQLEKEMVKKDPPWVHAIRKAGIAHFAELGFPTIQNEEWRFTNVAPLAKRPFKPIFNALPHHPTAQEIRPFTFPEIKGCCLVLINGHYSEKLSSFGSEAKDIEAGSLKDFLRTHHGLLEKHLSRYASCSDVFVALNTAFLNDGVFLGIPEGKILQEPIHLLYITSDAETGNVIHPRNLIIAGKGSKATILETYVSIIDAPYFTNAVTEIVIDENASIEHCKIQDESRNAFHISTIQMHQDRNSRATSHSISIGAGLARNQINMTLNAEGIECILNGLYMVSDQQHVDHHTIVDHTKPHCSSHEFYHGILDGNAKGVFNGKIFVRKAAQKTDAKQTNKNLLLSDNATIDTKPQLEIFADDVKCTHGATVGQLDEDAIFYLRSRGIGLEAARQMLVHAFASSILNRISMESVRDRLDQVLIGRLEKAHSFSRKEGSDV